MPQPFDPEKARHPIIDRSMALMRRQRCAALIAAVACEWTRTEHALFDLMGATTGISTPVYLDGLQTSMWRTEPNVGAQAAFRAAESVHAKLAAFEHAWDAATLPTHLCNMRDDIFKQIRKRAKERNQVVHAVWCYVDDYPDDVLRKDISGDTFIRYTPDDFRQIVVGLVELQGLLLQFHVQFTGNNAGLRLPPPFDYEIEDSTSASPSARAPPDGKP